MMFGLIFVLSAAAAFAYQTIPFNGTLNTAEKKFAARFTLQDQDAFHLDIRHVSAKDYDVIFSVTDWDTNFFNISTVLKGSVEKLSDENGASYLRVHLLSKYMLLNNQPVRDVSLDLVWHKQKLIVRSLHLGPFVCSGQIGLGEKPVLDLELHFSGLDIQEAVRFLNKNSRTAAGGGSLEGDVRLKGRADQPQIQGRISSHNGFMNEFEYDSARIQFEGIYPRIFVHDSHIAQADGFSFSLTGSLDLSDFENLSDQLKNFVTSALVSDSGQNLEWTLKRTRSQEDGSTTEFKYMLHKESDEEGGIIGIEKRLEF